MYSMAAARSPVKRRMKKKIRWASSNPIPYFPDEEL